MELGPLEHFLRYGSAIRVQLQHRPAVENAAPTKPVSLPLNLLTFDELLEFEEDPRREQRA